MQEKVKKTFEMIMKGTEKVIEPSRSRNMIFQNKTTFAAKLPQRAISAINT